MKRISIEVRGLNSTKKNFPSFFPRKFDLEKIGKSKKFQNLEKGPKRSEMWWNAFLSRLEVWIRPKIFPSFFPRRFDLEKIGKSKNFQNLENGPKTFRNVMKRISIEVRGLNSTKKIFPSFLPKEVWLRKNWKIEKFSKSWKWSKTFRNVMKRISIEVRGLNSTKIFFHPTFFPRRFDLEKIGKSKKFQNLENGPKRSEMWWNAFLSRLEVWIRPKKFFHPLPRRFWLRKIGKSKNFQNLENGPKTFRNVMKRISIEVRRSEFDQKKFFHPSSQGRFWLRKNWKIEKFQNHWKWSQTFRNVMKRISIEVRGLNSAK